MFLRSSVVLMAGTRVAMYGSLEIICATVWIVPYKGDDYYVPFSIAFSSHLTVIRPHVIASLGLLSFCLEKK